MGASVSCSVSASDNVVVEILLGQSVDHSNASHGQGNRTAKASKKQPAIRSSKRALVALLSDGLPIWLAFGLSFWLGAGLLF